jgi:hypothetical protein
MQKSGRSLSIVIVSAVYVCNFTASAPRFRAIVMIALALSMLPLWFAEISAMT